MEENAERIGATGRGARLTDAVFEMLKREIGGGSTRDRKKFDSDDDDSRRRSVMLHAEVHNYAAECSDVSKEFEALEEERNEHGETAGRRDVFKYAAEDGQVAAEEVVRDQSEETDEMLREVERKMERLRVLSSSHDDDAGNRREIGGDIENGHMTNKRKVPHIAARQNITPKQKRTNQKVLACVVGILFFALFVSTFVWLWTNEAEPWIEKSIRENREHLTYERIVYEPIDHSNNFDS